MGERRGKACSITEQLRNAEDYGSDALEALHNAAADLIDHYHAALVEVTRKHEIYQAVAVARNALANREAL